MAALKPCQTRINGTVCGHGKGQHGKDGCNVADCPCIEYGLQAASPSSADHEDQPARDFLDEFIPEGQAPIGGHQNAAKDGPGLDVYRTDVGILKVPHDALNLEALANEATFLETMIGSGFAPELIQFDDMGRTLQEDLGASDDHPHDGELFRRRMIRLLWELRTRGIRHGDTTSANIILKADWPWLIDFQEAHSIDATDPPQKQPCSDAGLLFRTVKDWPDDLALVGGVADTPRVARRWLTVLRDQGALTDMTLPLAGKRFLDLGCFQGDFVAMAACEGMRAWGVDAGGFNPDENSIEIARELWAYMDMALGHDEVGAGVHFDQADIMNLHDFTHDIVLMFSTWSYLVRDHGLPAAMGKLEEIIHDCGVLYFENHLAGDGPAGEDWWPGLFNDDDEVQTFLEFVSCGARGHDVTKLETFDVTGRPASRTVFRVEAR